MRLPFFKKLDGDGVDRALDTAIRLADTGDEAGAWKALDRLIRVRESDLHAARGLALALAHQGLDLERRLELATELLAAWPTDGTTLARLGEASEALHDYAYLNAAPPGATFFEDIVSALLRVVEVTSEGPERTPLYDGLTTAGRVAGRVHDRAAEDAHLQRLKLQRGSWQDQYNYGLFLKTRGRFREGLEANQAALKLGGEDVEAVLWNLGICATGAGEGELALEIWRGIGQVLELGDDGLPVGSYPPAQVRLARYPLAERDPEDEQHPGDEETVWIERLSPCHGRVRNGLYGDLGVDYGDLVLFDGAPIVSRRWGDEVVPVFPHLVTLRREPYERFRFAATQQAKGDVASLSEELRADAELYVLTESFQVLCRSCWEDEQADHLHETEEHRIVTGKLCVPPDVRLEELAAELDRAASAKPGIKLFVPELHRRLGDVPRADVEERRMNMLNSSQ